MKGQMKIHYDKEGDFLEISVGKPTKCNALEIQPGIFVRKDEKTDEIISVGILGFKSRSFKDVEVNLPVEISLLA